MMCLRLIWRRVQLSRTKLTSTLIAIFLLLLIFFLASFFNRSDTSCQEKRVQLLDYICNKYRKGDAEGPLCDPLCNEQSPQVKLLDCPNMNFHDGKEHVFTAEEHGKGMKIVKMRQFMDKDLPPLHKFDRDRLLQQLQHTLNAVFVDQHHFSLQDLFSPKQPSGLRLQELYDVYTLVQENEYILSKVLGDSPLTQTNQLLPRMLGHCGSLYSLQFVPRIFDPEYLLPWVKHDDVERVVIARALMRFLLRFERLALNFEICDPKLEHFGTVKYRLSAEKSFNNFESHMDADFVSSVGEQERVLLIDSDMVYHRQIVQENIFFIKNCTVDQDCDLVQCRGICVKNNSNDVHQCEMAADEDNLGRICRLLFFVSSSSGSYFGLLGALPLVDAGQLDRIKELCSLSTKRQEGGKSNAWPRRREDTIDMIKEIVLQLDQLIEVLEK